MKALPSNPGRHLQAFAVYLLWLALMPACGGASQPDEEAKQEDEAPVTYVRVQPEPGPPRPLKPLPEPTTAVQTAPPPEVPDAPRLFRDTPPHIIARLRSGYDMSKILVSNDSKHVYALDRGRRTVLKLDARTLEIKNWFGRLPEHIYAMTQSTDGRSLYLAGPVNGVTPNRAQQQRLSTILRMDADTLQLLGEPRRVDAHVRVLFAAPDGQIVAPDGSHGGTNQTALIDPETLEITQTLSTAFMGIICYQHPDRRRYYHPANSYFASTWIDPAADPAVCATFHPVNGFERQVPGSFTMLAHGAAVINREGKIMGTSNNHTQDLYAVADLDQENLGAIASPEVGVLATSVKETLQIYAWPSLEPATPVPHPGSLIEPVLAPDGLTAYARWQPNAKHQWGERFNGDRTEALVAIDVKALNTDGLKPPPEPPAPTEDDRPYVIRQLDLHTKIGDMVMSPDGKALFVLDEAAGVIHRVHAGTLQIEITSAKLPDGAHDIAIDRTGKKLAIAAAPTGFVRFNDKSGKIALFSTKTLKPLRAPIEAKIDPFRVVFAPNGNLMVTSGSYREVGIIEIDAGSGKTLGKLEGFGDEEPIAVTPDGRVLVRIYAERELNAYRITGSNKRTKLEPISVSQPGREPNVPTEVWTGADGLAAITRGGGVFAIIQNAGGSTTVSKVGMIDFAVSATAWFDRVFAIDRTNTLTVYEYPSLKPLSRTAIEGLLEYMCYDPDTRRLYAASFPGRSFHGFRDYKGTARSRLIAIDTTKLGPP